MGGVGWGWGEALDQIKIRLTQPQVEPELGKNLLLRKIHDIYLSMNLSLDGPILNNIKTLSFLFLCWKHISSQ